MPAEDIRQMVGALPLPVLLIGASGRIEQANDRARAIFGTELKERHYSVVIRNPAVLGCIERALGRRTESRTEFVQGRGGRDIRYAVVAAPLVLSTGPAVLVSFEDITSMLDARQMRRDFVANVSHELRTPLTALLGYLETIRGAARDDSAARERFAGRMQEEALRMNRLIDDLLSLSRVESEERVRPVAPVDLAKVAGEVLRRLQPMAKADGVTLEQETRARSAIVPGDSEQLGQVIANLVENAIKYGAQPGTVVLRIGDADDDPMLSGPALRLEVIDQGPGIDPVHIPRLTERFYRVDSHRSRAVGGTGLGLAIVKHIVNRHRGRLRIDSAPGKGSRMVVYLPRDGGSRAPS